MSEHDEKKKQVEVPLLTLNDPQACPPDLSTWSSMKKILSLSLWPMVGMLFHPLYTIVNSATTGRMAGAPYLAGFGLGSLTLGILLISIVTSQALSLNTKVSQAKGAGDPILCRHYLHKQWFITLCTFPILMIPLIFIKYIFGWLGQDPEVAALATQYVHTVGPFILFHGLSTCSQ
mgnify:CR=1 FL=1